MLIFKKNIYKEAPCANSVLLNRTGIHEIRFLSYSIIDKLITNIVGNGSDVGSKRSILQIQLSEILCAKH